ncbi:MAG: NAD(P)/FAD-dependent oxidoreductase [Firmicutes bacterium]|nr:NAD(P)/FAD-dependent oxidoreductase [Bacillota bacterium]
MTEFDVAVIGAGPAGLAASIEAARRGCRVLLMDSNLRPGGQLVKQIHKFFGSKEHRAGTRGIDIAVGLHREALEAGVVFWPDTSVYGVFPGGALGAVRGMLGGEPRGVVVRASTLILATGASENAVNFPGWTLPGVMGAGAAQTMINVERVLPGRKVLMVGSGNVGLIVSYQLMQAGADVEAVVEALPRVGGYGVHAAKISRAGVPILTSHTVLRAFGETEITGAEIARIDESWTPVPGTSRRVDADLICIAAGLRPYARLAMLAGCRMTYSSALGGWLPLHDRAMRTSVPGVYVAGDVGGVEEASTALEEGRIAGISASERLGMIGAADAARDREEAEARLSSLRMGPFGRPRYDAKEAIYEEGANACPRP